MVGRFAAVGYGTPWVDLLSGQGIPVPIDAEETPTILAAAPVDKLLAELRSGLIELGRRMPGTKIGVVGFGLGGTLLWQLLTAGEPIMAAAVPFYGLSPDTPDFTKSRAAVMAIYPEKDRKLNESQDNADTAMLRAKLVHRSMILPGTEDAFFNEADPRYDGAAATKAWQVTLDWFRQYLQPSLAVR